jgi:hypothetical protein
MGGTKGPLLKNENGPELRSPLKKPAESEVRKAEVKKEEMESSPESSEESVA